MASDTRTGLIPGIIVVLLGLFLLLIQFFQAVAGLGIGFLGLAFLLGYYLRARLLGLLIPGLILLGVGAFVILAQARLIPKNFEPLFLLFLGISFLLVYVLHTRRETLAGARNWPLFPALILSALGVIFLMVQNEFILNQEQWGRILQFWPVILVGIGLWLLLRRKVGRN